MTVEELIAELQMYRPRTEVLLFVEYEVKPIGKELSLDDISYMEGKVFIG